LEKLVLGGVCLLIKLFLHFWQKCSAAPFPDRRGQVWSAFCWDKPPALFFRLVRVMMSNSRYGVKFCQGNSRMLRINVSSCQLIDVKILKLCTDKKYAVVNTIFVYGFRKLCYL